MRRVLAFASALTLVAMTFVGFAETASAEPVLQHFTVAITDHNGIVLASGAFLNTVGRVTSATDTVIGVRFPNGPATITLTPGALPTGTKAGLCASNVEMGTFDFEYTPTNQPGFRYGGTGAYTSTDLTRAKGGPKHRCSEKLDKKGRLKGAKHAITLIDAGATELHAIG